MNLRRLCLACLLVLGFAAAARAAADVRFTKLLSAEEFAAAGLGRLSSDQLASLDALVRRDADIIDSPAHPRAGRFSERLLENERGVAGLGLLAAPELAQLDTQIERLAPAVRPVALGYYAARRTDAVPLHRQRRPLEVHGQLTLLYGAGSGGYSEMGGSMVVDVYDPDSGLAFSVGYGELRTKGGYLRRDCRDGFDRFTDLGLSLRR